MSFTTTAICVVAAACVLGAAATALACRVAPLLGLVDRPDARRKLHGRPIPLGGGAAVLLSTTLVLVAAFLAPTAWRVDAALAPVELLGLLAACGLIVLVGLLDDRFGLRGRHKLLGQAAAAAVVALTGATIQSVDLFGWRLDLGYWSFPFTMFWLLGAINAINLLDGIDGLAGTLGLISSAAIAAMAALTGHPALSLIAMAFASSLFGFLLFNFPPAKIFLGDAGSMLIGLLVGTLAIQGALKGPGTVMLAAPLAFWAIPIFDSLAAILRRRLTGRSVFCTDRGHLHHCLMDLLGSNRKTLAAISVACMATSTAGLFAVALKTDTIALVTCAAVVGIFIATGAFGRAELMLVVARAGRLAARALRPIRRPHEPALSNSTHVRLQGTRRWELLGETLAEYGQKMDLVEIRLDINLPALRESFNIHWERQQHADLERLWQIDVPLCVDGQVGGRILIAGERNGRSPFADLDQLCELMEPFEVQLEALAGTHPEPRRPRRKTGNKPQSRRVAEKTRNCSSELEARSSKL